MLEIIGAVGAGAFTFYIGVAVVVGIFGDAERSFRAREILRDRLGFRRPGRPRKCPDDVLELVVAMRQAGARLVDICWELNDERVPTPSGSARWLPSHVSRLLRTVDAQHLLDDHLLDDTARPR